MGIHLVKNKGTARIWAFILFISVAILIFGGAFALYYLKGAKKVTSKDIESAEKIAGLRFSRKERNLMLGNLKRNIRSYEEMREVVLENHVPPSIQFNPLLPDMIIDKESITFSF